MKYENKKNREKLIEELLKFIEVMQWTYDDYATLKGLEYEIRLQKE